MTATNSLTCSYNNTTTNQSSQTQTSTATIYNPSASWKGPLTIYCYLDNLFQSFMFSFTPPPNAAALPAATVISPSKLE